MKKIISVVGARPNFMKMAPIHKEFEKHKLKYQNSNLQHLICHTGQHYDEKMSKIFFNDLELPKPNYYLGVGSGSHAEQTSKVMIEFEKVLIKEKPDLVIVVGDVNSTVACSLTAKKLHIKVAHVEAGLRSFDVEMPEEINRMLTDRISDYLFNTEKSGLENLNNEGIPDEKVFFVGNVMIDSLVYYQPKVNASNILNELGLQNVIPAKAGISTKKDSNKGYVLVTLHRLSNVNTKESLEKLVNFLNRLGEERKVVFPIHPRTKNNLAKHLLNRSINQSIASTLSNFPIFHFSNFSLFQYSSFPSVSVGSTVISIDPNYYRPTKVDLLIGDASKAKEKLVWEAKTDLNELVKLMVEADLNKIQKKNYLNDRIP